MNIKEGINIGLNALSARRTRREMDKRTIYETSGDEKLVAEFLRRKKVRLPFVVALNAETSLPPEERIGLLFFTALVSRSDELIDTSSEFSLPQPKAELERRLLSQQVWDTGLTIEGLTERTLNHFSPAKQIVIRTFLDQMLDVHANRERQYPQDYSYQEALVYRRQTNDAWVEATLKLIDPEVDTDRIEKAQRFGLVAQHIDDIKDWVEDADNGSTNLFIGKATDLATEYPDEFDKLMTYVNTPKEKRPKGKIRKWVKDHMPNIRSSYLTDCLAQLNLPSGLTKSQLWVINKIL